MSIISDTSRSFLRRIKNFFINTVIGGVVVILPIALFIVVIKFVYEFSTGILSSFSNQLGKWLETEKWVIDLIALASTIIAFFFIGLVVRTSLGKQLLHSIEVNWLEKLPFYKVIRDTVQQFTGQKKAPFSEVVLVDVFSNDTRMVGFITEELTETMVTVFVPTGPNPTNGFIFHVNRNQIEYLEVKPEEAMRTIIGVGTGSKVLLKKDKA